MPTIGKGFDTARNIPKALSIFGDTIVINQDFTSSLSYNFSAFRTIAEFRENFKITSGIGVPTVSGINLNAALEVSRSLALDQDVLIYVMHVCGIRSRLTVEIDEEKFETDKQFQHARKELQDTPYSFCSKYGDGYVKRISRGGEVALVMRFKRNIVERNKRMLEELHVRVSRGVDIQQAINLLRDSTFLQLKCDIYTQTKGFAPEQLPPSDPTKLGELSSWLASFSEKFYNTTAEAFHTTVSYEIETYDTILPLETVAIVENTAIRARYFFAIYSCVAAIDYYLKYFHWIGNLEQHEAFQLKKQIIDDIIMIFDAKQDLTGRLIVQSIDMLKNLIVELNAIELTPRLVDEFKSDDLKRNWARTGSMFELRISPSFQIPSFPEDLPIDSFMFEILKEKSTKPLRGNLSLLYSFNRNVPFGAASHEIARHINLDTRNNVIVPYGLGEALTDVSFAYHLKLRRSVSENTQHYLSCLSPCLKTSEDDFCVRTYVVNKRPGPIMAVS